MIMQSHGHSYKHQHTQPILTYQQQVRSLLDGYRLVFGFKCKTRVSRHQQ